MLIIGRGSVDGTTSAAAVAVAAVPASQNVFSLDTFSGLRISLSTSGPSCVYCS